MFHLSSRALAFILIVLNSSFAVSKMPVRFGLVGLLITLTFLCIGMIAVLGVVYDKSPLNYTLNIMHWFFILLQYFYASSLQIYEGKYPWNANFDEYDVLKTNLIILTWCVCYFITYNVVTKRYKYWNIVTNYAELSNERKLSYLFTRSLFFVGIVVAICSFVLIGRNMFTSRNELSNTLSDSGSTFLHLYTATLRFVVGMSFFMLLVDCRQKRLAMSFKLIILLVCVVLVYFPSTSSRAWLLSVYLGIVLTYMFKVSNKFVIPVLLLLLILFVAPRLGLFRNNALDRDSLNDFVSYDVESDNVLNSGNYDCYVSIGMTLRYVEQNGITYGRQLLGVALFYLPRAMWPGKPVGSGAFVFSGQGYDFTNISSPVIAEGFINFGILGVVIFAIVVCSICCKIDYEACLFRSDNIRVLSRSPFRYNLQYVYYMLVGYYYIILRGDLLSSISNLSGILFPIYLVSFFNKPHIR